MKSLIIKEWGNHEFFINEKEIEKAKTGGEILEAIRDYKGNPIYSPMRCQDLAKTIDGKKIIKQIRGLCESGGDKGKSPKKGKAQETSN